MISRMEMVGEEIAASLALTSIFFLETERIVKERRQHAKNCTGGVLLVSTTSP